MKQIQNNLLKTNSENIMSYNEITEQGKYVFCVSEQADDNLSNVIYKCKVTRTLLSPVEILKIAK